MITFRDITDAGAADAYFAGAAMTADERAGRWLGVGCDALGLAQGSSVARAQLRAALDGHTPSAVLYERLRTDRRPGYDFCLSADKSLSVAALCLGDDTATSVRNAWDNAVRDTWLNFADPLAAFSAKHGHDKSAYGLAVAEFTHFASRHGDPHYHSHLVHLNTSRDPLDDDRLRNLDPRRMMAARKSLDTLFNHNLAHRLRRVGIQADLDAVSRKAVIAAVPELIRSAFSRAQAAIRDSVAKHPAPEGVNAFQWAGIINDRIRPEKPRTPDFSESIPRDDRDRINEAIRAKPPETVRRAPDSHEDDGDIRSRLASDIAARARKISSSPSRETFVACIAEAAFAHPHAAGLTIAAAADIAHAATRAAPKPKTPAAVRDERLRYAAELRRKTLVRGEIKKRKSAALRAALSKQREEAAKSIREAQRLSGRIAKLGRALAAKKAAAAKRAAVKAATSLSKKANDAAKALLKKIKTQQAQRDLAKAARLKMASNMRP